VNRVSAVDATHVLPGDVILVQIQGRSWFSRLAGWAIRLGSRLARQPSTWNHVIVAHHIDAAGVYWGVQGQPGMVGWVDLAPWLAGAKTVTNAAQPKTDQQRQAICDAMTPLVGTATYDWAAIAANARIALAAAIHVTPLWGMTDTWGEGSPGHVICSSLADYGYESVGLASPRADRFCNPADWAQFIQTCGWEAAD
jgi:hypothetical protein